MGGSLSVGLCGLQKCPPGKCDHFDELYERCAEALPGFQEACKGLRERFNGSKPRSCELTPSPLALKSRKAAKFKFTNKYNDNASKLTDVLRASFIFEDASSLWAALRISTKS